MPSWISSIKLTLESTDVIDMIKILLTIIESDVIFEFFVPLFKNDLFGFSANLSGHQLLEITNRILRAIKSR
jgi:hypothetical protein